MNLFGNQTLKAGLLWGAWPDPVVQKSLADTYGYLKKKMTPAPASPQATPTVMSPQAKQSNTMQAARVAGAMSGKATSSAVPQPSYGSSPALSSSLAPNQAPQAVSLPPQASGIQSAQAAQVPASTPISPVQQSTLPIASGGATGSPGAQAGAIAGTQARLGDQQTAASGARTQSIIDALTGAAGTWGAALSAQGSAPITYDASGRMIANPGAGTFGRMMGEDAIAKSQSSASVTAQQELAKEMAKYFGGSKPGDTTGVLGPYNPGDPLSAPLATTPAPKWQAPINVQDYLGKRLF